MAISRGFIKALLIASVLATAAWAYWRLFIPVAKAPSPALLRMSGDLNDDGVWSSADCTMVPDLLENPYVAPAEKLIRMDLNGSASVDPEDLQWLDALCATGDPYKARDTFAAKGEMFAQPRELFDYVPANSYRKRPVVLVARQDAYIAELQFLFLNPHRERIRGSYESALSGEILDEALRFSIAYRGRQQELSAAERTFAAAAFREAHRLFTASESFELLYHLIMMVELAETTYNDDVDEATRQIRLIGEDLARMLSGEEYAAFVRGEKPHTAVLEQIVGIVERRMGEKLDLDDMGPARDLTELRNYVDRAVWQKHKLMATPGRVQALIDYAQQDRRYLRAVARTTPRHHDVKLRNHNIAMMLLFRQALRISQGNKRAAVGLIDEVVRVPFQWIRTLPAAGRPSSVALDHFLLPGNMEDGTDKSRHWNVFGGLALYRSPGEALRLAFAREIDDVRREQFSATAMTEFVRDMVANCNGIYHVSAMRAARAVAVPSEG